MALRTACRRIAASRAALQCAPRAVRAAVSAAPSSTVRMMTVYLDPNFPKTLDGRVHHLDLRFGEGACRSRPSCLHRPQQFPCLLLEDCTT